MSPAETLRAAATLIRETAADAGSDLWDALFPDSRAPHIKATNAWVRLMHPGLAEHLAASLEDHVQDHDAYDCTWPEDDCPHVRLARSILGRTS